ncbi:MAG: FHA domain-containing protein [Desulfatiglandales bacterium]
MIHIEGPLKGQIQEFSETVIPIGRHPSCLLRYPADLTIISRKHATILREGNRFKLIDTSANGTFVNGKRLKECYLEDGDVLTISEGGPKVSFLTEIREGEGRREVLQKPPTAPPKPPPEPPERASVHEPYASEPPSPPAAAPLVIQFGPTIRTYKQIPVQIGSHPDCAFVMDHPGILGRHAEISFSHGQYRIKDLTGRSAVHVNGRPIQQGAALSPDDEIALSPQGPIFRFLGEGRLAEVEPPLLNETIAPSPQEKGKDLTGKDPQAVKRGSKSIFKKYFGR